MAHSQSRKVAFIGTHGVGKTVLTLSLTAKLRTLGIDADTVAEVSRLSPFPINEATTLDGQLWILAAQWRAELEASLRTSLVVCDRALIDNYAYLVRAAGEQPHLHPLLRSWSHTYDVFFLVPIVDAAIVADKKRATARGFQEEIQARVRALVEQFGLTDRVVELPPHRDEHLTVILRELRERKVVPRRQLTLF